MNSIERLAYLQIGEKLSDAVLAGYHLKKLNETIGIAEQSAFYGGRLERLDSLADMRRLPFTTPEDITFLGCQAFLCVAPGKIDRVVTLNTSGTAGKAKSIAFTAEEINSNMLFFRYGLEEMIHPGERLLIFFPGTAENGVSDLLAQAAGGIDVITEHFGAITDAEKAASSVRRFKPDCIAGIPGQIAALADFLGSGRKESVRSVLLSGDSAAASIRSRIQAAFSCEVFDHYGMTETGYGGALECSAHNGLHLREAEMYFEIVDPLTNDPLPPGYYGELVFTAFRAGMPLIRYRTGDRTRFIPGACPCGKILRRIEPPVRIGKKLNKRVDWN